MYKSKVVVTFVLLLCMLFMVSLFNENYNMADIFRVLIVPSITVLYLINKRQKPTYFTLFLVAYSISDLLSIFNFDFAFDYEYFIGNGLYILSYLALSYHIISSLDLKYIFKNFKIHLLVLLILNIYTNYVLLMIEQKYLYVLEFSVEIIYNIFTLLLLSISLINYFYRDDKKAFILFLGTLSIVVSEVIQIAYYYIPDVENNNLLSVTYSILIILAFYFYYSQSKLEYEEVLVIA